MNLQTGGPAKNATVLAYGFGPAGGGDVATTARRLSYCHFADKGAGESCRGGAMDGEQYRQKLQLIRLLLVRNRLQVDRATHASASAALKSIIKNPSDDLQSQPHLQPSSQKPLQACLFGRARRTLYGINSLQLLKLLASHAPITNERHAHCATSHSLLRAQWSIGGGFFLNYCPFLPHTDSNHCDDRWRHDCMNYNGVVGRRFKGRHSEQSPPRLNCSYVCQGYQI